MEKLTLTEDVLVIADQEAPLALAGIMGVSGLEFLRKQQPSSLRAHILIQLLSQGRLVVLASTRMHQRVLNAG